MASDTIRAYTSYDEERIFALAKDIWGPDAAGNIRKTWDWLFLNNPFIPADSASALVLESSGNLAGLFCSIFTDLKAGNAVFKLKCVCHFGIHPAYRGKGIRLFKHNVNLSDYSSIEFPQLARVARLEAALGGRKISDICRYILILNMGNLLRARLKNGFLAYIGNLCWKILVKLLIAVTLNEERGEIKEVIFFDQRFDRLWEEIKSEYEILTVRSSAYLNWRFRQSPLEYSVFAAEEPGRILGYIVLRIANNGTLKSGLIADLFAHPKDLKTISSLLDKAVSYFSGKEADYVEYRGLPGKGIILKMLRRKGFFLKRYLANFMTYTKDRELLFKLSCPEAWFVTASESEIDFL